VSSPADIHAPDGVIARARDVLAVERDGLDVARDAIDEGFVEAVAILEACAGRVVVTGVGKSGLVGRKLAATLSSTGSPALFIHPVDAVHGDLGVLGAEDVVVLCSHSGETAELLAMVPILRRVGGRLIAITAERTSALAGAADATVCYGRAPEAASVRLVPTTSTTAMLAVGDALAVVLMERRGFEERDFAFLHPGGVIGRKIARTVADLMHAGDDLARVGDDATLESALLEILRGRLGVTVVVDAGGRLAGVLTDGDLKRILIGRRGTDGDVMALRVADVMSVGPRTITPDAPALRALERMENNPGGAITSLVVVDDEGRPVGVVHIHDCLRP